MVDHCHTDRKGCHREADDKRCRVWAFLVIDKALNTGSAADRQRDIASQTHVHQVEAIQTLSVRSGLVPDDLPVVYQVRAGLHPSQESRLQPEAALGAEWLLCLPAGVSVVHEQSQCDG